MTVKPTHYFWIILIALLTACGTTPKAAEAAKIQNTAFAIVQTSVALTQTALPTATLPPPTFTPNILSTSTPPATATFTPPVASVFTPDALQVERWKEYQAELAKAVLSSNPELGNNPAVYKDALCEWDILGQSGQEVYVYAVCVIANGNGDMRKPVIVYLEPDGSIQKIKPPEIKKANSEMFDYGPFPIDVQEKFCYYFDPFPSDLPPCPYSSTYPRPRLDLLYAHIEYRKTHSEEPPLVVLSAMSTATPTPLTVYNKHKKFTFSSITKTRRLT
ncbi:hypothetical protein ANAEL_04639 [Anaerolineales bacterium]|nr:hypothetical protein ANAEL_04639 [Anaerolineales bacterium]